MRVARTAIGATMINPKLLTYAERLQYEGHLRRNQDECLHHGAHQRRSAI
jgi:hypothetical protein